VLNESYAPSSRYKANMFGLQDEKNVRKSTDLEHIQSPPNELAEENDQERVEELENENLETSLNLITS